MLQVSNVNTFYGKIQALRDVSLMVNEGEVVALIGANGAGKTTLLNTICGVLTPKGGTVAFEGKPIHNRSVEDIVRMGVSHVPERRQIFSTLTVEENLLLGAYTRFGKGGRKQVSEDIERMYALFPILKERSKQTAGTFSGGQQQMLAVARGLMSRPRLLLLDEPSLGLAPLVVQEIFRSIQTLREQKVTILLIEQNARAALRLADRAYVLEGGRIKLEGKASDLLTDESVSNAYLGQGYH
jgi:branched-chain amino acid transport system ATP-binding protein